MIGGKVEGHTWHHHQDSGRMQLLPLGLHKIYFHKGGRSTGMWAEGKR
ncbi:HNH endonuclease [Motilimonas pumila]